MDECQLTVIVPAYNHERFIRECLDSINDQTYRDFQWIVVDDGSKDSTPEILKELQPKYGFELVLQKNKGCAQTMTETIRDRAKGTYISACASDDKWTPNHAETMLRFMQQHPDYGMCFSRVFYMDLDSEIIGKRSENFLRGGDIFEEIICRKFQPGVSIFWKKKTLQDVGFYKDGVIAEDFYLNCKIAQQYRIGFVDDYLAYYRKAPLETKRDPLKLIMSHKETIDAYKDNPIYHKALNAWKLHSAMNLAPYVKYKGKALGMLLTSGFLSLKRENLSLVKSSLSKLLFRWINI